MNERVENILSGWKEQVQQSPTIERNYCIDGASVLITESCSFDDCLLFKTIKIKCNPIVEEVNKALEKILEREKWLFEK